MVIRTYPYFPCNVALAYTYSTLKYSNNSNILIYYTILNTNILRHTSYTIHQI